MFKRFRRWLEHHHRWPLKQIGHALYWLRTHTYNKYHIIDCRSPHNGYSWGWFDRSSLILFANMAILVEYVEKEADQIDWTSDPSHSEARSEMEIIYQWWLKGRKIEHDDYEALLTKAYGFDRCTVFEPCEDDPSIRGRHFVLQSWEEDCRRCDEAEEALEKKDEEMMIRLIKIRGHLWS